MAVSAGLLATCASVVLALCALGVFLMRDPLDKLHYLGPAATIAPVLVAAAIALEDGPFSQSGLKAACVAAIVVFTSPLVQFATLRAIVTRRYGSPRAPVVPEIQT